MPMMPKPAIAIPTGFVSHDELRRVVIALISIREREPARSLQ
jgi:hypothetical protein